eukprot:PhM_4_TR7131/c0_g1_i1/m.4524/K05542/DUS1; tRNA-dihydrouridine synthase 1
MDPKLREQLLSWRPTTCPYCVPEKAQENHPNLPPAPPTPHDFPRHRGFYEKVGSPKFIVAPMVDQSELAFRLLCKKYGAALCYTPMFHALNFSNSESYRNQQFTTCEADRPVVVQFCANDPVTLLAAAKFVEDSCDAVDLNLGCPQGIAKKGYYGSFLMENWELIHTLIHTLHVNLKIPVTAKMRVFPDKEVTLAYAKMLVDAGASWVGVHGRTRDMKGGQTGLADWEMIRAVREHLPRNIPVFANGNVLCYDDAVKCIEATGTDGVMSAEGLLFDPRLFSNPKEPLLLNARYRKELPLTRELYDAVASVTKEYFTIAKQVKALAPHAKAHVFKLLYHLFVHYPYLRSRLGDCPTSDHEPLDALESTVLGILGEMESLQPNVELAASMKKKPKREREDEDVKKPSSEQS